MLKAIKSGLARAIAFDKRAMDEMLPLAVQLEAAAKVSQASANYKLASEDWEYFLEVSDMEYHVSGMVDPIDDKPAHFGESPDNPKNYPEFKSLSCVIYWSGSDMPHYCTMEEAEEAHPNLAEVLSGKDCFYSGKALGMLSKTDRNKLIMRDVYDVKGQCDVFMNMDDLITEEPNQYNLDLSDLF